MLPVCPGRHKIRICNENPGCIDVRAKDACRAAGLNQQRLIVFELAQTTNDRIVRFPVTRRLANATVHNEVLRALGNVGIEIIHEHAQWRFGQPALGVQFRAGRRSYHAWLVHRCKFSSCTTSGDVVFRVPGNV